MPKALLATEIPPQPQCKDKKQIHPHPGVQQDWTESPLYDDENDVYVYFVMNED